mmetsp:Transcript_82290/g.266397  ORF Transcript_82290/g.266397 Transcript_82290/m.266397 type:complete len:201 (-) Transcript_82290:248-850(-)
MVAGHTLPRENLRGCPTLSNVSRARSCPCSLEPRRLPLSHTEPSSSMSPSMFVILMLLAAAGVRSAAPVGVSASVDLGEDFMSGSALSFLQGHATKIIKKRAGAAAFGGEAVDRQAAARAAVAFDDDLGSGGIALIQEKHSKIKAPGSSCQKAAGKALHYAPKLGSIDAALLAAAADGVDDGMFALNLLQERRTKAKTGP